MREEARNWIRQATADLGHAEWNIGLGAFEVAAFLSQQAVEKLLKGHHIHLKAAEPPRTYTLLQLGVVLSVPKELLGDLRVLTPEYIVSRYPDAANGVPAEIYDEPMAQDRLGRARAVFDWAKTWVHEAAR